MITQYFAFIIMRILHNYR